MTDPKALVAELAGLNAGPLVVTLYLDVSWKDEQQRERVRVFFRAESKKAKALFQSSPDWADLEQSLDRMGNWIDQLVNQDVHPEARGALLVASAGRDLFLEAVFGEPMEPAMFIDQRPRLFPLVELISRERPILVVSLDSSGAEIFDWRFGEMMGERDLEKTPLRMHSKQSAWLRRKFGRHIRPITRGVWKDCSVLLTQLAEAEPLVNVILLGQEANLRGFDKLLPKAVTRRVIAEHADQPHELDRLNLVRRLCADEGVAHELSIVDQILHRGLSERSGTVGLEQTLLAVNERRVGLLALSRRFSRAGFLCTNCGGLWPYGASRCVFCAGRTVEVPLAEEIARRCVVDGAELLMVSNGGALEPYEGIGSLLRPVSSEKRRARHISEASFPVATGTA